MFLTILVELLFSGWMGNKIEKKKRRFFTLPLKSKLIVKVSKYVLQSRECRKSLVLVKSVFYSPAFGQTMLVFKIELNCSKWKAKVRLQHWGLELQSWPGWVLAHLNPPLQLSSGYLKLPKEKKKNLNFAQSFPAATIVLYAASAWNVPFLALFLQEE